jgi:hypothetical protein
LPDAVKNKDWTDAQIETFVKAANAALKTYGDEGKAIATGISQADEKKNRLAEGMTLKDIADKHGVQLEDMQKQYDMGCEVEKEHTDDKHKACDIALDHLFEDPKYYTKLAKMEKSNSVSQKPNFYYARHMQPGTCRYEDEMILVDTDAIKGMIKTGCGIPVYIQHKPGVPIEEIKDHAVGYVTESFYNELDGWAWFKFIAVDDEARQAIANNWAVSNAYIPSQSGESGTKNNVEYDREILSADFTHLAIVPDPRYEDACIMTPEEFKAYQEKQKQNLSELQNSKGKTLVSKGKKMFKFFKTKREEVSEVDSDTQIELEGGEVVTVGEMMNAMKKNSDDEKEKENQDDEDEKENEDDGECKKKAEALMNETVEVGDESMTLKELVNRYKKMNEKKNAEDEESKKKEEEEKENGKTRFEELQNAHKKGGKTSAIMIETSATMVKRGQERYGSPQS